MDDKSGIELYLNCRKCVTSLPRGESASSYQRLSVGAIGETTIRIWCERHQELVADFEMKPLNIGGCEHPDHNKRS